MALGLAALATVAIWGVPWKSSPPPPRYTALALPGMAIDAPGTVLKQGGYGKGEIEGALGGGVTRFDVAWNPGGATDSDTAREIASAIANKLWPGATPAIATQPAEIAGHPGIRLLARAGDRVMVLALASCGGRGVTIMVEGDAAAEIADHMIASFTCTPDPAKDVLASEVVFAAAPGWQRRPDTQVIDGPGDLDVRYIAFTSDGAGSVADRVERYVPASYQLVTPATSRGDKVLWIGTRLVDTDTIRIAVLAWRCNDDHRIAMAVVESAANHPLDDGIAFAATGRCLPPDHSNE
ncbi:MAG TPA: hypothetical protein VLX92_01010 [Kofleriaceae bacterium]|nr:hypothetical protein [Kofleriaceae bacterium]